MKRVEIDWSEIRDFYEAGNDKRECLRRFGISDWDWHTAVGNGWIEPRTRGVDLFAVARRDLIGRLHREGYSYAQIGARLGLSKGTVAYHCRRLGVPVQEKCARRYDWTQVQAAVDNGKSVTECMEKFGFARATYTQAVKRGAVVPRQWIIPIEELLVKGPARSRGHLKARLTREGLKENRCEICGITDWNGKSLSMELHHVNGDGCDNRLENLKLLCGNCHSQTPNWGGRGIGRAGSELDPDGQVPR